MTLASAAEVDGAGKTVVVADVDPDGPAAQKASGPATSSSRSQVLAVRLDGVDRRRHVRGRGTGLPVSD